MKKYMIRFWDAENFVCEIAIKAFTVNGAIKKARNYKDIFGQVDRISVWYKGQFKKAASC